MLARSRLDKPQNGRLFQADVADIKHIMIAFPEKSELSTGK
jgi:hypothetical protein